MTLFDKIIAIHPTLNNDDFNLATGTIYLQDDGQGAYIAKWEHPEFARPTEEQLA